MDIAFFLKMIYFAFFFVFLPGYAWSYLFFKKGSIDLLGRTVLSMGLSVSIVPFVTALIFRFLKIDINFVNLFLIDLTLIIIPLLIMYAKGELFKEKGTKNAKIRH